MNRIVDIANFVKTFEDLEVYQRAYQISLQIHKISKTFPKDELYALTTQIRRASKSVCANIAEGYVKQGQSSNEFGRFLSISIGSCGEMIVWINYCYDLGYIDDEQKELWKNEYQIIIKMLQKLRNKIKS